MFIFLTNEALIDPGKGPLILSYKHDNELSGFIKVRKLLEQRGHYQLFKKSSSLAFVC
jgi:hypothetical protein